MNYVHYEDSFLCSRDEPSICNMYVKERGGGDRAKEVLIFSENVEARNHIKG